MRHSIIISILLLPLSAFAALISFDTGKLHRQRRSLKAMPEDFANTAKPKSPFYLISADEAATPLLKPSYDLLRGSPGPFPEEFLQYSPTRNPTLMQRLRFTWNLGYVYFQHLIDDAKKVWAHFDKSDKPYPLNTPNQFFDALAAKNEEIWREKGARVAAKIEEFNESERKKLWDFEQAQSAMALEKPWKQHELYRKARKFHTQREKNSVKFMHHQKTRLRNINEPHSAIKDWVKQGRTKAEDRKQRGQVFVTEEGKVIFSPGSDRI